MFSISVGHSHTLSSLLRITNCVHYESFKNCIYSKLAGNSSNHLFHDVSMSVAHSVSFRPVRHKSNYVPNESLQISFCQKLLATDQTR